MGQDPGVGDERDNLATNMRVLIAMRAGGQNKEAARAIGASEHAVGRWLNGRGEPSAKNMRAIGEAWGINASKLWDPPYVFLRYLAAAEEARAAEAGGRLKLVE
jgi:transcriptional regulator with XRE-family HTH domain